MAKSPSYKQADCCNNTNCNYLGLNENEPCWGEVKAIDNKRVCGNEFVWIHICQEHAGTVWDGKYIE